MANFEKAFQVVIHNEGTRFVNDPSDAGGASRYGISLRFYKKKVKIDCTADDIRNLSISDAERIYKEYFWDRLPFEDINSQHIANRLFDLSVNCGPSTATGMIQRAINSLTPKSHLIVDGGLGVKTLDQINLLDEVQLYNALICEAARYYHEIAEHRNNKAYLQGWLNRLNLSC